MISLDKIIGAVVSGITVSAIFWFGFSLFDAFEDSPIGENEYSAETLEQGRLSLEILQYGRTVAGIIGFVIGFVGFVGILKRF